jgi:cell division protein FtsB
MARLPTPGLKARWILTVVLALALMGAGFTYYNRQKTEQENLLATIAQSDKTIEQFRAIDLSKIEAEIASLEDRNESAQMAAATLTSKYRAYTHSIEIGERMYEAAGESNVTINSMEVSGPTSVTAGTLALESYVIKIDAEAAVPPQLLNFLQKISDSMQTGTIESVNLNIPRPPDEGTSDEVTTMTFQYRVFYVPQGAA